MSFAIVCHGCGAKLTVPDDYPRNKMQCPECGVMCQVPPRPAGKRKAQERKPAEEAARFEDDEPAAPTGPPPVPPQETGIAERPISASKGLAACWHCGEVVRVPERKRGRRRKCPACGVDWPQIDARSRPAPPPPRPVAPPPDEFAGSSPDEDPETSNPYRTADKGARRCAGCSAQLGPEVVVCVRCGFDLRIGRKTVKEYQKFDRSWDSGMPLKTRLMLFGLCQVMALTAIIAGFLSIEDSPAVQIPTFGISWLIYTAMTGFLLGTFDHIHLKRYKSGRVDLVRMWRIGFIPCPQEEIDVRAYFGVTNGATAYAGLWEWLVFLILLGSGIVPAVVYWYCAIHKIEFSVSLTNEHENPEIKVYRGWSEEQMQEINQTLRDAMTV
jgi:DNA-directed RNA polymerase subunit M/transcription elongation factor TFIIS